MNYWKRHLNNSHVNITETNIYNQITSHQIGVLVQDCPHQDCKNHVYKLNQTRSCLLISTFAQLPIIWIKWILYSAENRHCTFLDKDVSHKFLLSESYSVYNEKNRRNNVHSVDIAKWSQENKKQTGFPASSRKAWQAQFTLYTACYIIYTCSVLRQERISLDDLLHRAMSVDMSEDKPSYRHI